MKLLSHSQARYMAESMWGPGGTTAYRTNRRGAFHFSCSGHGGFVIDDRALTDEERKALTEGGFEADACWGVRAADGSIRTIRHPLSEVQRPRKVTYHPSRGEYVDGSIPVWVFEEDCDWAAVYVYTGIRSKGLVGTDEELVEHARGSLSRWGPPESKALMAAS